MLYKSRFPIRIVSLLVGISVLLGLGALLLPVPWSPIAVSAHERQTTQEGPTSPDAPLAPACTNCHSNIGFNAYRHHVAAGVNDADCQVCHPETSNNSYHDNGTVQLLDPDQTGVIYTVAKFGGQRNKLTAADIASLTAFCYKCHDGNGAARLGASAHDPFGDGVTFIPAIGTHSNEDFNGEEADFHVGCIQCHASHGSNNLAIIDNAIVITPGLTGGPVTFTSQTGANSRDDGTGNGICVICHTNSNNSGYPMHSHSGGDHTAAGGSNMQGTDCSTCHPHDPDSNPATQNGHMPADANAVGLHGMLAQSGLWPAAGLVGVLLAFVVERRRRSKD